MADVAMATAESEVVPDSPLLVDDDAPGEGRAKSEDRQDVLAEKALERQRRAALAARATKLAPASAAAAAGSGGKRKRTAAAMQVDQGEGKVEDEVEERVAKRRRRQPGAVLLDTGRIKTVITATTLVNLRPMMFLSSSMRWGPGPPLGVRRGACAVALLDETRLLVVGGNEGKVTVGSTEVLDLAPAAAGRRMVFTSGPSLATQRRECAVVRLDEFRLLVVGGYDGEHFLLTTEIIDVRTMQVTLGPRMVHRRAAPAVSRFEGLDRVVVVGGKNAFGCLETSEVLDVRTVPLEFKPGPSLRMQRAGATAVPLDSNRVIVIGGHDSSRTHNTTEILHIVDPGSRMPRIACAPGPELPAPRSYFAGVMLNAGNVQVIGGHDGYNYLSTTDVLNLATMEYSTGPSMRKRRFMCSAAALSQDRVIVLGGTDVSTDHQSTEILRLPTYSFAPASWMSAC